MLHAHRFLLACFALVLTACSAPAPNGRGQDAYALTILHTNDHHGRFWRNRDGEYGMAARKTVVDRIRAEVATAGGYSLLLDGGDVNTGVPESDMQDAVPDFMGMNLLGYDAMAVGNHEFDKPPEVLSMQRGLARFPMLSANIYRNGQRMFAPYTVFTLGGLRVAVMGLTTEDTQKMAHPDNVRSLEFRSAQHEAAQLLPELRQQADVVIAATHMGHYENGVHGTQAAGDVELARAVPGIDVIVGGHTQNPACMKAENQLDRAYIPGTPCTPDHQNGTWIVQAHEWGKYVGRADFVYRNGALTLQRYALIPINLAQRTRTADGSTQVSTYTEPILESASMLHLLEPYYQRGQHQLQTAVGHSLDKLDGDRAVVRSTPTALGVLVARAMMDKTHADLAIVNAGGIRDSLPAGKLSYRDVLTVHPFGNTLAVVELNGQELEEYLAVIAKISPGAGGFAQFAGIDIHTDNSTVVYAAIAGKPIEHTRRYRMVINNFVAAGGDGYPPLLRHPSYYDTGFVDADVLRAYIAAHSPLAAADYAPTHKVLRP